MSGAMTRANGTSRLEAPARHALAGSAATRTATGVVPSPVAPVKLLRFPVVRERTGLSRSTIWRLERRGEFPKHHRIAPNVVAWSELEVSRWIEERLGSDDAPDDEPVLVGGNRLR